jgi:hypothetical protein
MEKTYYTPLRMSPMGQVDFAHFPHARRSTDRVASDRKSIGAGKNSGDVGYARNFNQSAPSEK